MYNCITNKHHILYDPYRLYLAEHRRQPLEPYMPFWSRLFARGNPIQKEQIPHVGRGWAYARPVRQVPMRERHECHCMLFLKDDNPFASLGTGSVPKVKVGVVGVVPGTKDGRILLFYKCPCQVQAKLVQFLWKSWSTWRTGPFLFFWCR